MANKPKMYKNEYGWIVTAGGAVSFNPTYWNGLEQEQRDNLMKVTYEEQNKAREVLDTMQREYYSDYRAGGDSHEEALSKAILV